MRVTLYIFDMGGVVAVDTDVFPSVSLHLGMTPESFAEFAEPGLTLLMNGAITSENFWKQFSSRSGMDVRGDLFATYFTPRLDPDMAAMIRILRSENRVVCGTNTLPSHYDYLEARGYYDLFDAVYASNKIGVSKPRPEFYRYILEAEDVRPAKAVFIDDFAENVQAAAALGIPSILFRNSAELESDIEKYSHSRSSRQ